MIVCIYGGQGSGKTLYGVRKAFQLYSKGMKVYSNFKLRFPYTDLKFDDIINCRLENCCVILDEAHLWGLNSRDCMSSKNKAITQTFLVQLRKKNVVALIITQRERQIDVRVRENADNYIYVSKWGLDLREKRLFKVVQSQDFNSSTPIVIKAEILFLDDGRIVKEKFLANKFYHLYNTSEVIKLQDYEKPKAKKKN